MRGNSGNTRSNVIHNSSPKQYGPTVKPLEINVFSINLFSRNNGSLNRSLQFKKNSSKVLFAIVLILALVQFGNFSKQEIKIKRK